MIDTTCGLVGLVVSSLRPGAVHRRAAGSRSRRGALAEAGISGGRSMGGWRNRDCRHALHRAGGGQHSDGTTMMADGQPKSLRAQQTKPGHRSVAIVSYSSSSPLLSARYVDRRLAASGRPRKAATLPRRRGAAWRQRLTR